jgi:fructose-bisphosphate aldolase class II
MEEQTVSLLTLAEILKPSVHQGWAVGAYDIPDVAVAMGVLDAAVAGKAPVILMVYPTMTAVDSYPTFVAFMKKEIERSGATAAITLDHGSSLPQIEAAIQAGFTGVMIDASAKPFEENIELTRKVVEMAHRAGVSVEAELGHVGTGAEVASGDDVKDLYTSVDDARRFVECTGVDALAVAIGTVHGIYRFTPHLDFERLSQLRAAVNIPLVLHGSSGTPNDQLRKAVELGINKVNVYTDIRLEILRQIQEKVATTRIEDYDFADLLVIARQVTASVVQAKNKIFKAVGKA